MRSVLAGLVATLAAALAIGFATADDLVIEAQHRLPPPAKGWQTDWKKAVKTAKEEGKLLFVTFR